MHVERFELPLPRAYSISTDGQPIQPRSEGQHLSGIRDSIARKMGKLRDEGEQPACFNLMACIGIAWEDYMFKILTHDDPDRYNCHPGEVVVDGIAMSPDMIEYPLDIDVPVLHEIKTKWMRPPREGEFEKKHWRDIVQVKCYCNAIGTRYAYLHVLYIVWWPTGMPTPISVTYKLEFEEQELVDCWQMIVKESKLLTGETT